LQSLSTADLGLWGSCTLPGWFCAACYIFALAWLGASWHVLSEEVEDLGSDSGSFVHFVLQSRVIAVLFVGCFCAMAGMACEQSVPIVTKRMFGWSGALCGMPLAWMAITLVAGQVLVLMLSKRGCSDRALLLAGSLMVCAVFALGAVMWNLGGSSMSALVIMPFLLLTCVMPFAMLGSFSTFTRLAVEEAPNHMAKIQAVQNNVLALSLLLAPVWLSWSYSSQVVEREGVPLTCWTALAVSGFIGFLGIFIKFKSLQAPPANSQVSAPLLKDSA
jgi:hypothetical protein